MSKFLGQRMRELREKNTTLSARSMSRKIEMSDNYMTNIEAGHGVPSLRVLERINEIYGTSFIDIFEGVDSLFPDKNAVVESQDRVQELENKLEVMQKKLDALMSANR